MTPMRRHRDDVGHDLATADGGETEIRTARVKRQNNALIRIKKRHHELHAWEIASNPMPDGTVERHVGIGNQRHDE